ncbi:MAG: hypothetical protein J6R26_08375 [Paludibacteraceae bacterium]|nr:hypothetical protein [Paludibacteraceae bacterium]
MTTFKTNDKKFVAENRIYLGELPAHLAHTGVPKDVSRTGLFRLIQREGNTLRFKTGMKYAETLVAKVLPQPTTGAELCFVDYRGARIMLDASCYMLGGVKLSESQRNVK